MICLKALILLRRLMPALIWCWLPIRSAFLKVREQAQEHIEQSLKAQTAGTNSSGTKF